MLLIQNGTLHTMEEEKPIRADLLIRDRKIVKIQPNIQAKKEMSIIDAEGLHIYPGFIDAHSHIGIAEEQTTAQTDSSNEGTNPVTPFVRAIDGINPMDSAFHNALAAGITGVMVGPGSANPIGGQFAFIKTHGRCVDDMVVLAPAAKEGWGEHAALRAITIDTAKICRVDHRLGSLKEGKDADLAIFDGNPMEIASSVRITIINGEVVWSAQ